MFMLTKIKAFFASPICIYIFIGIVAVMLFLALRPKTSSIKIIQDTTAIDSLKLKMDTLNSKLSTISPKIDSINNVNKAIQLKEASNDAKIFNPPQQSQFSKEGFWLLAISSPLIALSAASLKLLSRIAVPFVYLACRLLR